MRRAGVICEFNPFHNGHKFLLENIKSVSRTAGSPCSVDDAIPQSPTLSAGDSSLYQREPYEIICIMSSSFVQRGDIAITDKFARARAALENGADMVVELPTVYAMAPAQVFAQNGVRLARELGCDILCFGAENSLEELYDALDILDSGETQAKIAASMKAGSYYPRALSDAVGEGTAAIISKPNNILALEYIRACREYGIEPVAFPRKGADHDSGAVSGDIASATKVRELILSGGDYTAYTPMNVAHPAQIGAIESAVLYRLKTMTAAQLAALPDVSEGLENRIAAIAAEYNSLSELYEHLKTKRYTMARLRRILLSALLDITREMQRTPVPYVRVLGVREDKKHLIASENLPLIVDVKSRYDQLNNSAKEIFDVDLRATSLMNIATGITNNDFSHGVIIG